jgi:hypothetical protein
LLLVGGLVLLGAGGVLALTIGLDATVKAQLETIGSTATGTPVVVEAVTLSLWSGKGEIRGLTIRNPAGFDADDAFVVDRLFIDLRVSTLRSEIIVIEEIRVEGALLTAEQPLLQQNNLTHLLNNLRAFAATSDDAPDWTTRLVIEELSFNGSRVTLHIPFVADKILTIPDVEARDIGRPTVGVSVPEASLRILEPLLAEVLRAVQLKMLGP